MSANATRAVGVDIGGTGIKGAVVDLSTGELLTDRIKVPTPRGAEPDDVLGAVREVLRRLEVSDWVLSDRVQAADVVRQLGGMPPRTAP